MHTRTLEYSNIIFNKPSLSRCQDQKFIPFIMSNHAWRTKGKKKRGNSTKTKILKHKNLKITKATPNFTIYSLNYIELLNNLPTATYLSMFPKYLYG